MYGSQPYVVSQIVWPTRLVYGRTTEAIVGASEEERKMSDAGRWAPLPPMHVGIRGRCPRCGQGRLFEGFLKLRKQCEVCALDYSFADPADGPAFFVICLASAPSVGVGLWLEIAHHAPYWVHLFTTFPFILLT